MKMVSAAKLKGDENRLKLARPFNAWTAQLAGPVMDVEDATFEDLPQNSLSLSRRIVVMGSAMALYSLCFSVAISRVCCEKLCKG